MLHEKGLCLGETTSKSGPCFLGLEQVLLSRGITEKEIAKGHVRVWFLNKAAFDDLIRQHPDVVFTLFKALSPTDTSGLQVMPKQVLLRLLYPLQHMKFDEIPATSQIRQSRSAVPVIGKKVVDKAKSLLLCGISPRAQCDGTVPWTQMSLVLDC